MKASTQIASLKPSFWHKSLLIISIILLYYISYRFHVTPGLDTSDISHTATQQLSVEDFQRSWLDTYLLQPFNPSPIQALCNSTTWRPNLVFNLADANGGVGNVRAEFLDFLFYAMEAGASIVLPGMARRSEAKLFDVWGAGRADFSTLFDREWFVESLAQACPEMKVWDSIEAVGPSAKHIEEMYRPGYPLARRDTTKEKWLKETDMWLQARNIKSESEEVTIVDVGRTMWEVNTRETTPGLRVALPMVLRINPSIRSFAGSAMAALESIFHGGFPSPLVPSDRLHQQAFYGAHLRTEADTVDAGWQTPCSETECGLNWTTQTDAYMQHAIANSLKIIYVASGNATEIERFKVKAAANNVRLTVIDKWDLLDEQQSAELKKLH